MTKLLVVVMLIVTGSAYAGEIYTCKVNGSNVYQAKPCSGSKELNQQVRDSQKRYFDQKAKVSQDQAEWNSKKEPKIGMTKTQVEKSTWGYPQRYSENETAYGLSEFWHYGSGRMVYFRNGIAVSISK